ncbi:hypothetical protein AB3U99_11360 [Niallia sp. JL1B1071]|uniref:hypothetical protein n=1 Tax=Niallia tiangongensis TaxID=3237105 RepID=UPI0037DC4B44
MKYFGKFNKIKNVRSWLTIQNLILYFISYILVTIIHELGHAFFVRIYGGEVKGIGFGKGDILIKIGKFYIKRNSLIMGSIEWKLPIIQMKYKYIMIYLGGIIFNLLTGTLIWIFGNEQYADYYRNVIVFSYLIALFSLIPFKFPDNSESDGLKVLHILMNKGEIQND